jgi:methyl-accepting chemotaxis protein
MKIKMTLKTKMLVYILSASLVIYSLALGYVSLKLSKIASENAEKLTKTYAKEYANYTKADLSVDMNMTRALGHISMDFTKYGVDERKNMQIGWLEHLLVENPTFLATWYSWELSAIWPDWEKPFGRQRLTYYRNGEQIKYKEELVDTVAGFTKGAYYDMLEKKVEYVMDPYYFNYQEDEEAILMTSVAVVILNNGEAAGVAGLDLSLERFQDIISEIHPIEESYAFLVANNGRFVAHDDEENIGNYIQDITNEEHNILEVIQNGENYFYTINKDGRDYWVSIAPVYIGQSPTPWSFGFVVPVDIIMQESTATLKRSIIVGTIGLLLIALIIWIIAHSISRPVIKTTAILSDLAEGDIDESKKINVKTKDEIGEMGNSVNTLIEGLNKTAEFAQEIGKGNLEKEFDLLSDKDVLGNSLLEMRKSLKIARKQEEERKLEDQKQNWATQGLAKFGEILRQNNDDMQDFSYHIISNLVKYINANQGGIFMVNDDDKNDVFVELLSFYAYERRKYMENALKLVLD